MLCHFAQQTSSEIAGISGQRSVSPNIGVSLISLCSIEIADCRSGLVKRRLQICASRHSGAPVDAIAASHVSTLTSRCLGAIKRGPEVSEARTSPLIHI